METTSNQHRFKPWCFLAVSLAIAGCSSKLAEVDPGTPRGVSLPEPSTGAPSEGVERQRGVWALPGIGTDQGGRRVCCSSYR